MRNRIVLSGGVGAAASLADVVVRSRGFTRLDAQIERLHEPWSHIPGMERPIVGPKGAVAVAVVVGAAGGVGYGLAAAVLPGPYALRGAVYSASMPLAALLLGRKALSGLGVEQRPARDAFPIGATAIALGVRSARGALLAHVVERLRA